MRGIRAAIALDRAYADVGAAEPPGRARCCGGSRNSTWPRAPATRVVSFNTALELMTQPGIRHPGSHRSRTILTALKNTSRTWRLRSSRRQPAQLATAEVRLKRLTNLLRRDCAPRVAAQPTTHWRELNSARSCAQVEEHLPSIGEKP